MYLFRQQKPNCKSGINKVLCSPRLDSRDVLGRVSGFSVRLNLPFKVSFDLIKRDSVFAAFDALFPRVALP